MKYILKTMPTPGYTQPFSINQIKTLGLSWTELMVNQVQMEHGEINLN